MPFSFGARMDYTRCMAIAELHEALAAVESVPRGRRTGAFFDVDGAVIAGDLTASASDQRRGRGVPDVGGLLRSRLGGRPAPGGATAALVAAR
jgi:hypothetical protein